MKTNHTPLLIVISLFFLSLAGCREKGTPFSFTTPEGEEVSITVPEGFEDQRSAKPWKNLFPDEKQSSKCIASYINRGSNTEDIMELYFILREDTGTTKKWRRKPENRDLYDYTEYSDSNFICVLQIKYIDDPDTCSLEMNSDVDGHLADLYLQKQILYIDIFFPHDSLMTERAKEVMNEMVKSIKIEKHK